MGSLCVGMWDVHGVLCCVLFVWCLVCVCVVWMACGVGGLSQWWRCCVRFAAIWCVCPISVVCGVHVFSWCTGGCGMYVAASLCVIDKSRCWMGGATVIGHVCAASGVPLWCGCLAFVWHLWGFFVCSICVIVCACVMSVGVSMCVCMVCVRGI